MIVLLVACSGEGEDQPIIKREVKLEIPRRDEPQPGACPDLRIRVTSKEVTLIRGLAPVVIPNRDDAIDRPRLDAALDGFRAECVGRVVVEGSTDAKYAYFVELINAVTDRGFKEVSLGTREP